MSRTKSLSDVIIAKLKDRCTNIYYEDGVQVGIEKKKYPFVTFELYELGTNNGATRFSLEIDVIDYGKAKSTVEMLADDIQNEFDFYIHLDENIQFRCYKDDKKTIKEDDKLVLRKRITIEVVLYDLKGA